MVVARAPRALPARPAAGEVFQAVVPRRAHPPARASSGGPGVHVPEIAGIPQHILDAFSKRSAEIDAWLAATGTPNTPEGRQAAVLATRRNKPEREHRTLRHRLEGSKPNTSAGDPPTPTAHRRLACAATRSTRRRRGGSKPSASTNTATSRRANAPSPPRNGSPTCSAATSPHDRSTFTQRRPHHARSPQRLGAGATVDTIERLTRRVLASPHVIAVAQPT